MRLSQGGLIDRDSSIRFQFDERWYRGHAGDTLASALLANGVGLVGRSFKYHRPRGILTAGSEEPNALVHIGKGAHKTPNIRATTQELYQGLYATSQNAWPSLKWDVMEANNLLSPFLGAGFYYKTFMWPRSFWEKVYEPLIRRAAGLGALSGQPDPDLYEKAFAQCDLLVIGSGPTGLMAALTAARAGADVILADENERFGGRLLSETGTLDGQSGSDWATSVIAELSSMDNVRLMTRTTVTGAYDGGTYGALERVSHHFAAAHDGLPLECFWRIAAKRTVLAAGALERPVAFANNDRPGIMLASAVRSYVNRYAVAPGKKVAVFGNNDDAHQTVRDLQAAGVEVVALIDNRAGAGAGLDVATFAGQMVTGTKGRLGLSQITLSSGQNIEADCLAVSGGWNPTVHMTCHMNGRPEWRDDIASFVPRPNMVPGMIAAGACNGDFSTTACLSAGIAAAKSALGDLRMSAPDIDVPEAENAAYALEPLWQVPGKGRAWLDFQNDVTTKDIKQAVRENMISVEHMKRYTTQGMATDQGKNSNVSALAVLADATGRGIPETGTTTFRPPYVPVALSALGAGARGKGFAPERLTTSHAATLQMSAPMMEAGLWYRPSYFPKAAETTWRQSCDREVGYVREAVGVCDVSTLGKIDLKGPDAGRFLDFVYANMFSTLKSGKVRYGLMLREDGHVMDDGTTARLGEDHYLMTTTTAAAGQVMKHLDYVQQLHARDMKVRFTSVTEHWAQFAVAGPKARALISALVDEPITDENFPFMGCAPVTLDGIQARLFRISFSGEHAYEIAVPARHGDALFRDLVARAEALGGGAYGMEALNVLRIEKGFITHSEIHGRITADDIGFGRMVSAKKDCIGKLASTRPGLHGAEREQLVGLKPAGDVKMMLAGAHLFRQGAEAVRANSQGYITSAGFSPTLGTNLALGFLKDGRARHGEVIEVVDHLREVKAMAEVCDPVFFDPDGGRVRG
jgi:heterotetrameric sarcosine oxidase alpha subunit